MLAAPPPGAGCARDGVVVASVATRTMLRIGRRKRPPAPKGKARTLGARAPQGKRKCALESVREEIRIVGAWGSCRGGSFGHGGANGGSAPVASPRRTRHFG